MLRKAAQMSSVLRSPLYLVLTSTIRCAPLRRQITPELRQEEQLYDDYLEKEDRGLGRRGS